MSESVSMVTKPVQNLPTGSLEPNLYLNRELSLLEFNRRVIAQAEDESLPLLERCLLYTSAALFMNIMRP